MAWCGADIVVLDVKSDEYALLIDLADAIRPAGSHGAILADAETLEDLKEVGLVGEVSQGIARQPIPKRSGEIACDGTPSAPALAAAFFNGFVSTAEFHRKDIAGLVESATKRSARVRRTSHELAARLTLAFQTVQPWIPFEGDCLQRGFMLHQQLRRGGVPARWVFGVRTWPFLAHCWVQVEDLIVGDSLERVSGFTPIMAV